MPHEFSRNVRVGDQIQRVMAQVLREKFHDPRVGMISVSKVDVSKDLSWAHIFIASIDEKADEQVILSVLENAKGFLRKELSHEIKLKYTPKLKFMFDDSVKNAMRIESLLHKQENEDEEEPRGGET